MLGFGVSLQSQKLKLQQPTYIQHVKCIPARLASHITTKVSLWGSILLTESEVKIINSTTVKVRFILFRNGDQNTW